MSAAAAGPATLTLEVPKATGTQGDVLVAWGLAIFAGEALGDARVVLSDEGNRFRVETGVPYDAIENRLASFSWQERLARGRLLWLESEANNRVPKSDAAIAGAAYQTVRVDRDDLREAHRLWRARQRELGRTAGGEGPALTTTADPELYPFYEVLTNPGTQWAGYNSFVERLYSSLTPEGAGAVLATYDTRAREGDAGLPGGRASKKRARPPSFNPPGYLYPGMNKGPTMRVSDPRGTTVGTATAADWTLADRGDRSLFENYLAYIGYFAVARIVTTKELRVVAVPIPARAQLRVILGHLPTRQLEATNLTDYLAARSALDYSQAALRCLTELQGEHAGVLERRGMALHGAHLAVYWRPNGNTFAPRRLTQVMLPAWLGALRDKSLDLALTTLTEHQARLSSVRGRWRDERKLSPEQRAAIETYLRSLGGGVVEWLQAVAAWFPASRAAARDDWRIGLWTVEEVRRIATAMSNEHPGIQDVLDHPAFTRLASAIRLSTVVPHLNRERRKRGEAADAYPFDTQYDLVSSLHSAAERGPEDFLREFYGFVSEYNDETARPGKGARRAFVRTDDLSQLALWMRDRDAQRLVPYALLAFGTSLKGKAAGAGDIDTPPEDAGGVNGKEPDDEGDGD